MFERKVVSTNEQHNGILYIMTSVFAVAKQCICYNIALMLGF